VETSISTSVRVTESRASLMFSAAFPRVAGVGRVSVLQRVNPGFLRDQHDPEVPRWWLYRRLALSR